MSVQQPTAAAAGGMLYAATQTLQHLGLMEGAQRLLRLELTEDQQQQQQQQQDATGTSSNKRREALVTLRNAAALSKSEALPLLHFVASADVWWALGLAPQQQQVDQQQQQQQQGERLSVVASLLPLLHAPATCTDLELLLLHVYTTPVSSRQQQQQREATTATAATEDAAAAAAALDGAQQPPAAWWAELLDNSSGSSSSSGSSRRSMKGSSKGGSSCVLRESLRRVARLSLLCRFFYDQQPLQFSLGGFCCIWTARVRLRGAPPPYLSCLTPAPHQEQQQQDHLLLQKQMEKRMQQEQLLLQQHQLYRVTPETKIRLSLHPEAELYAQHKQQQHQPQQQQGELRGLRRLAGSAAVLQQVFWRLLLPLLRPDAFAVYGLQQPNGLLLWGPPGSGKTFLMKAIAEEMQLLEQRMQAAAAGTGAGKAVAASAAAAAAAAAAGLDSSNSTVDAAAAYSELLFAVVSGQWLVNRSNEANSGTKQQQQQQQQRTIFVPPEVRLTHATELVGSAPGETEENIHRLFEECSSRRAARMQQAAAAAAATAAAATPAVVAGDGQMQEARLVGGRTLLFIDEVDSICPHRQSASEAGRRQVAALLSCMDGLNSDPCVFVVGATNHREAIDEAVRRAGRLELEIELLLYLPAAALAPFIVVVFLSAEVAAPSAAAAAFCDVGAAGCEDTNLGVPSAAERLVMLRKLLQQTAHCLTDADIQEVADNCQAFVAADIALLMRTAATSALRQSLITQQQQEQKQQQEQQQQQQQPGEEDAGEPVQRQAVLLSPSHFAAALRVVRPSGLKAVACEVPCVRWSDIGGYEDAKRQLSECVEWPLVYGHLFQQLRLQPPKGVLLYGPPGCSKTMLAKAVATESKMNFVAVKGLLRSAAAAAASGAAPACVAAELWRSMSSSDRLLLVSGPELFSKWVGESEKAVRELFRRCHASIYVGGGLRCQNSQCCCCPNWLLLLMLLLLLLQVETRVLSQLLTEMDGIGPHASIVVLAATNRPDLLDAALLRPGRLDRLVYVRLPDEAARLQIAYNTLRQVPIHPSAAAAAEADPAVASRLAALQEQQQQQAGERPAEQHNSHKRQDGFRQEAEDQQQQQQQQQPRRGDAATFAVACWLSVQTAGFSGAEIVMLCKEAALDAIREHISSLTQDPSNQQQQQQQQQGLLSLHMGHLEAALQRMQPRTPQSLLQLYEHYSKQTKGAAAAAEATAAAAAAAASS
ncbi:hypothetical protein Emed_004571 [Eimeria media]